METENKLQEMKDNQQNHLELKDENINKYNNNESEHFTQVAESQINQTTNLEPRAKTFQKPLTPYQQYKQSKNKNGGKYFQFYDDIKVYTHNIYDW